MKTFRNYFFYSFLCVLLMMQNPVKIYGSETDKSTVPEELRSLYATAACLMDGDSGRVLFEKSGDKKLPMASTTKIMTLIITLENAELSELVEISSNAAKQPDVQLNVNTGEFYVLEDLLYSLMLESHNDAAYAIAEHVGGSVEGFASLMNQKAKEIGCENTYFITPNGLDADDENGIHSTTAVDLARIMSYCIKKSPKTEDFIKITRTPNYTFSNKQKKEDGTVKNGGRSFSCVNHNAFLQMMEGALSGKTGFTGNAGYCYVGALERDGKTLIVSLLACGWPNNKTYKWNDTKKLMKYGLDNYEFSSFDQTEIDESRLKPIIVQNGKTEEIGQTAKTALMRKTPEQEDGMPLKGLLLRKDEEVSVQYKIMDSLTAPVEKGMAVGEISYMVDGKTFKTEEIVTAQEVEAIDFMWDLQQILQLFLI